jgi:Flp pilus assembly protein TadB
MSMSKERARARAAREAAHETARAAERERIAKRRARGQRMRSLKPSLPELPRRRRRYGAMPRRLQLGLAFGWLVAQWLFWQLVADNRTRVGLAIVSLLALPILVVLIPSKGKR